MKRRARRTTIEVAILAVLAVAPVAVLAFAHWDTVRDHVEAWHFQLTRETKTADPKLDRGPERLYRGGYYGLEGLKALPIDEREPFYEAPTPWLCSLAEWSDNPVIYNRAEVSSRKYYIVVSTTDEKTRRPSGILRIVRGNGWRVLKQRFPQRAYVVIRDQGATR
jgi:hypothetical protein